MSKRDILKASGIIGGSQLINILVGIIRNKIAAILIGPLGVGVLGLFLSISDTIRASTSFGIQFSSIKTIAESKSKHEQYYMVHVVGVWAKLTGWCGVLITILLSKFLSVYVFKSDQYTLQIALISPVILFTSLTQIKLAILQGTQNLKSLVLATLYGSILSLFILPFYYFFGTNGIVPGLVATSVLAYFASSYYVSILNFPKIRESIFLSVKNSFPMIRLGLFIVLSSVISGIGLFFVRSYLSNSGGFSLLGNFQASWTISTSYIGILLTTMQTDFLPRLTSKLSYKGLTRKLINDQLEILFVVGSPIVILLIYFTKILIYALYSSQFYDAVIILQWNLLSVSFIFIGWTLGVYYLACGLGSLIILTDFFWFLVFGFFLIFRFDNLEPALVGFSYFIASVFKACLNFIIVRNKINFKFTKSNILLIITYFFFSVISFTASNYFLDYNFIIIGVLLFFVSTVISYKKLINILSVKELILKIKNKFNT
jgi:antigen flippase